MSREERITATAPGNLLICGEYMILEDQGSGLALATHPVAEGCVCPLRTGNSTIRMITDEGSIYLNSAMSTANIPFIIKVYRFLVQNLEQKGFDLPQLDIEINTAPFFSQGRKRGLGASAAATVLLTGLLFSWSMGREKISREMIARVAVQAHRHAQENKGSGYDILTSCHGSAGIFTGGRDPQWSRLENDHPIFLTHSYMFSGPQEVDSKKAVKLYQEWQTRTDRETKSFFNRSQELLRSICDDRDEEQFLRHITELRLLSSELGEHIGVEGWISPPSAFYERSAWKSSGAGNELGVLFLGRNSESQLSQPYKKIDIHPEGLRILNTDGDSILD